MVDDLKNNDGNKYVNINYNNDDNNDDSNAVSQDNINGQLIISSTTNNININKNNVMVGNYDSSSAFTDGDAVLNGDAVAETEKDDSGFVKSFPQRLLALLRSEEDETNLHKKCVSWTETGDAFKIISEESFVNNVLPKYFKRTKFASFKGKLYRWGFRRVNKGLNAGAYFHKLFVKDDPSLCLHMRRQLNKSQKAQLRSSSKGKDVSSSHARGNNDRKNCNDSSSAGAGAALSTIPSMESQESREVVTSMNMSLKTSAANNNHNPYNNTNTSPMMPCPTITIDNNNNNALPSSAFMSSKQSSQALLNAQAYARKHMHMMICNFNNFPSMMANLQQQQQHQEQFTLNHQQQQLQHNHNYQQATAIMQDDHQFILNRQQQQLQHNHDHQQAATANIQGDQQQLTKNLIQEGEETMNDNDDSYNQNTTSFSSNYNTNFKRFQSTRNMTPFQLPPPAKKQSVISNTTTTANIKGVMK